MKKYRILSLLFGICMLVSMAFRPVTNVQAAAATETSEVNEAVLEARKGILQIATAVQVDDRDAFYVHVGTGFLIGGDDGAQYVVTNYHVVHAMTEETARSLVGADGSVKVTMESRVIVKRDVLISAEVLNESQQMDFSILKLEQPIYDRVPLTLADSSNVAVTEEVYALGFPGIVQDIQTDELYTSDDVTVTKGNVSKTSDVTLVDSPIPCITHSAKLAEGNSGGPLVNRNGNVIGVNTFISSDVNQNNDYYYSTQINEVRDVLDAFGIEYKKADESSSADSTEPGTTISETDFVPETEAVQATVSSALLEELKAEIDSANNMDLTVMTEDSAEIFRQALNDAESVYRNENASDTEIEEAIENLQTAENGLVEQEGPSLMPIILIAAVAALAVIIVVIVVLASRSKKKKRAAQEMRQRREHAEAVAGPQVAGGWNMPPVSPPNMGNDGATETTVLNEGSGETTLLSGGAGIPSAYLVRKKNNDRILISKQVFRIGKERRRVDYCISDNTNVSRLHADIIFKNGEFYILDHNATNGTMINGVTLTGGQEQKLHNGDTVRFADEEFTFYM